MFCFFGYICVIENTICIVGIMGLDRHFDLYARKMNFRVIIAGHEPATLIKVGKVIHFLFNI